MTSETSSVEGQSTLSGPDTLNASASERTTVVLRVVGRIQRSRRVLGETLSAVPSHILDCKKSTIGREKHVEITRTDDGVVRELYDALQDAIVCRGRRCVGGKARGVTVTENIDVSALQPVGVNVRVERFLYVRSVEVDFRIGWGVISCVYDTQLAVWVGACLTAYG